MAVLEYGRASRPRFRWWHWTIAVLAGAFGGYVTSINAYEVLLEALAGGMQVTIHDLGEPFRNAMGFASLSALAGILIALSAMFICRFTRRNLLVWVALFLIVFIVGAIAGFVYERRVWTPRNSGRVAIGLSEVPVFVVPVIGCIAVVCFALGMSVRRRFAARPTG